jgi:ketosteroid isomerase-like protein
VNKGNSTRIDMSRRAVFVGAPLFAATAFSGVACAAQGEAMNDSYQAQRSLAEKIVSEFFESKERGDFAALTALFADDIVYTFPLNAEGTQKPWIVYNGKKETNDYQEATFKRFSQLRMLNKRMTVSHDGSVVFLESIGDYIAADGRPYKNVYVFKFVIKNRLIAEVSEYANPITFALLANLPIASNAAK